MKELSGKVCLLTGASGGIGAQLARRLAAEGMKLALVARRAGPLDALAAELQGAAVFSCDLTRIAEVERMVADVEATLGPIALLVNNAGADDFQHFEDSDPAGISRQVQLNLTAPLVLTRLVLPGMLARGEGHILSMASTAGLVGTPYGATYSATKAGVIAMSNSLRMEFADGPVGFSALCPGFVSGGGMHEAHKAAVGSAPAALGGTTVDAVVDAAVRIVRDDAPERIVNSSPLRPLIGLGRAMPSLANRLTVMLSGRYMKALADHRRDGAS